MADEEDDDYMTMNLADPEPKMPETSLQRRRRERLAAQERGRPKSKAELEAEMEAARERVLSRSLFEDPALARRSKGLAMMAKMGYRPGSSLGKKPHVEDDREANAGSDMRASPGGNANPDAGGAAAKPSAAETNARDGRPRTEPIAPVVKLGRGGIGLDGERKRKLEAEEAAGDAGERGGKQARADRVDPLAYRDRVLREQEEARLERQVKAAMGVAERLDENDDATQAGGQGSPSKEETKRPRPRPRPTGSRPPLKSIPVLYRGLVRARETTERERRQRWETETRLRARGGPTNVNGADAADTDAELDDDDRLALGRGGVDGGEEETAAAVGEEELDEDDDELDAFEVQPAEKRLAQLVGWLRTRHRYCFWCKGAYDDPDLDGCPGETEQDHE